MTTPIFEFDLQYRDKRWHAKCVWRRQGGFAPYGFDRLLALEGEGSTPQAAVDAVIEAAENLLSVTAQRIRDAFAEFDVGGAGR